MDVLAQNLPALCAMQDNLNERTTTNWKNANLNFAKAFYMEASEISNHIPWKWWKKEEPNKGQAFMEIVDLLHFWTSIYLLEGCSIYPSTDHIKLLSSSSWDDGLPRCIDRLVYLGVTHSLGDTPDPWFLTETIAVILAITDHLGYTEEQLVSWYIGKCALNYFRQDHGLKEGTYIKIWDGKEDNVYLESIIDCFFKAKTPVSAHIVWQELAISYATTTGQPINKCSIPQEVAGKIEKEGDADEKES